MALAFWLTSYNADLVGIWADAKTTLGSLGLGTTTDAIQKKLQQMYHDKGMRVLISAFGATEFPTSMGKDATETAVSLANFVLNNNVDGVDIDWEDNEAMNRGTG